MLSSLHPIRLMTRTDAEVTSVFHSFFLVEYLKETEDVKIIQRFPRERPKIDIIESGLRLFIMEGAERSINTEKSGNFVVTTSDGSRYYAHFRSFDFRSLIGISSIPVMTFCRKVFDLLEFETMDTLRPTLLSLCEVPVYPIVGLQYDFEFKAGIASLTFSSLEQVEDEDMDTVVLSLMSPSMLVEAWEAIILERKVLVVSSVEAVVAPCCEFLRRMVLPLVMVNTYVPLLPAALINAVEAPFPYLLGASTGMVVDSGMDLSSTVIIDLDDRKVIPTCDGTVDIHAPAELITTLVQQIHAVMVPSLGAWFSRPTNSVHRVTNPRLHPEVSIGKNPWSPEEMVLKSSQILQLFTQTNLRIISARTCSVNAFWRRVELHTEGRKVTFDLSPPRRDSSMGFNFHRGVYSGFMQLAKGVQATAFVSGSSEKASYGSPAKVVRATTGGPEAAAALGKKKDVCIQHFLPCWVEMDHFVFSVYQYADDLPVLYVPYPDLHAVIPSPLEPEGHVFELVTNALTSFHFTTTDSESREQWISVLNRYIQSADRIKNTRSPSLPGAKDTLNQTSTSNTSVNGGNMGGSSSFHGTLENNISYELGSGRVVGEQTQLSGKSDFLTSTGEVTSDTWVERVRIGLPTVDLKKSQSALNQTHLEGSRFRFHVMKTQSMTSLQSLMESKEFQPLFKKRDRKIHSYLGDPSYLLSQLTTNLERFGTINDSIHAVLAFIKSLPELRPKSAPLNLSLPNSLRAESDDLGDSPGSSYRGSVSRNVGEGGLRIDDSVVGSDDLNRSLSEAAIRSEQNSPSPLPITVNTEKSRTGIFRGFFSKRNSKTMDGVEEEQQQWRLARELEHQRDIDREAQEEADLKFQLFLISSMFRRCQSEINTTVVETRLKSLSTILTGIISASYQESLAVLPIVKIPVKNLINPPNDTNRKKKTSEDFEKTLRKRSGARFVRVNDSLVERHSEEGNFYHEERRRSFAWHDFIWEGLVGRTWTEYCEQAESEKTNKESLSEEVGNGLSNEEMDFILESQNQDQLRQEIRDNLFSILYSQYQDTQEKPLEQGFYAPIYHVLMGFVEEERGNFEESLSFYSKDCLVEQERLMNILVQIYLKKAEIFKNQFSGNFTSNSELFLSHSFANSLDFKFLQTSSTYSSVVCLHATRMWLEMVHCWLLDRNQLDDYELDFTCRLGSFRYFSSGSKTRPAEARNQNSTLHRFKSRNNNLSSFDFMWSENETKSDVLNESYTCLSLKSQVSACEVSVELLLKLRDILKAYCKSPAGLKIAKVSSTGVSRLKITQAMVDELQESSAFKAIELECCILQKVSLRGLSLNERLLFFVNAYNLITVHALIARGSPGNGLIERSAFLRNSKYNLGGVTYSLLDIEHGVLRHSSTKPMVFGPLTISITFADRDPRKRQVLEEARPNISFCLFSATSFSPSLAVLKNPKTVDDEMKRYARKYICEYVKMDLTQKSVSLPGLLRVYWADFGGNRAKVLRNLASLAGQQFANEIKPFFSGGGVKPRVEFLPIEWTPMFILHNVTT